MKLSRSVLLVYLLGGLGVTILAIALQNGYLWFIGMVAWYLFCLILDLIIRARR